jgi:LuxR family maltose regulon positive regulatory protein
MMNFASQEINEWRESNNYYEFTPKIQQKAPKIKIDSVKLFADKLRVPAVGKPIARPRLVEHLEKSLRQFSATLIAGRAGTGKTVLAADFARQSDSCVVWYKVETADSDWKIFASYLASSLNQNCSETDAPKYDPTDTAISSVSERLAAQFNLSAGEKPILIVLDDIHSVFDAEWFEEFFTNFVPALAPNVHLLMIARTLPSLPLWRLRSKQVLGVMDEKLLAFTSDETVKLFRRHKLSPAVARTAHKAAYGKVARLEEIIEKKSAKPI